MLCSGAHGLLFCEIFSNCFGGFQAFAIRQPLRSTQQHLNFRPTSAPGFYFLHFLQTLVGGPSVFEDFFKSYIKQFSFKTVTSDAFKVG